MSCEYVFTYFKGNSTLNVRWMRWNWLLHPQNLSISGECVSRGMLLRLLQEGTGAICGN